MSKNQIIAKAMLTGLGIYAVVVLFPAMTSYLYQSQNFWPVAVNILLLISALLVIGRFMIFKNDGIACKLAGQDADDADFDRRTYLIKTFRIAMVVLGLSLLSSSRTLAALVDLLRTFSLPQMRLWMRNVIHGGQMGFSWKSFSIICELFKLIIIAYLLCGGSKLIRWHLKNSNLSNTNEELTNE